MTPHHHPSAGQLTKNQSLVLETLSEANIPLSAYTILDNLRSHGLRAPLQVYRALEKLILAGHVHRLESLNSFVACQHSNCDQNKTVAFTICNSCDHVNEVSDPELSSRLNNLADGHSFQLQHSVVELRGVCQDCTVPRTA